MISGSSHGPARASPYHSLPRIGFRCLIPRPWPDFIEFGQCVVAERDVQAGYVLVQLFDGARADDWAGDAVALKDPRKGNVGVVDADGPTQFLVGFDLRAQFLGRFQEGRTLAANRVVGAEDAGQQAPC